MNLVRSSVSFASIVGDRRSHGNHLTRQRHRKTLSSANIRTFEWVLSKHYFFASVFTMGSSEYVVEMAETVGANSTGANGFDSIHDRFKYVRVWVCGIELIFMQMMMNLLRTTMSWWQTVRACPASAVRTHSFFPFLEYSQSDHFYFQCGRDCEK